MEELDVVKRDFRTVAYGDGLISNNVMSIELIPSRVYELTYPSDDPCMAKKKKTCPICTAVDGKRKGYARGLVDSVTTSDLL